MASDRETTDPRVEAGAMAVWNLLERWAGHPRPWTEAKESDRDEARAVARVVLHAAGIEVPDAE